MDRGGYGHPPQRPIGRALVIVHASLIASLAFALALAEFIKSGMKPVDMPPVATYALAAMGASMGAAALVLRYMVIPGILAQSPVDPSSVVSSDARVRRVFALHVVSFALAEAVGLLGMAMTVLGKGERTFLLFFAGGFVALIGCFPSLPRKS